MPDKNLYKLILNEIFERHQNTGREFTMPRTRLNESTREVLRQLAGEKLIRIKELDNGDCECRITAAGIDAVEYGE